MSTEEFNKTHPVIGSFDSADSQYHLTIRASRDLQDPEQKTLPTYSVHFSNGGMPLNFELSRNFNRKVNCPDGSVNIDLLTPDSKFWIIFLNKTTQLIFKEHGIKFDPEIIAKTIQDHYDAQPPEWRERQLPAAPAPEQN